MSAKTDRDEIDSLRAQLETVAREKAVLVMAIESAERNDKISRQGWRDANAQIAPLGIALETATRERDVQKLLVQTADHIVGDLAAKLAKTQAERNNIFAASKHNDELAAAQLLKAQAEAAEWHAGFDRQAHQIGLLNAEAAAMRKALELMDPHNAIERYDLCAEAFWTKERRMAPGKSRPMEMGADPDPEGTVKLWNEFAPAWLCEQINATLRIDAGRPILEALSAAREALEEAGLWRAMCDQTEVPACGVCSLCLSRAALAKLDALGVGK